MKLAWFLDPQHNAAPQPYRSIQLTQELSSRTSTATIVYRQPNTAPLPAALTEVLLAGRTIQPNTATWSFDGTLDGWTFPNPAKLAMTGYDTVDSYSGPACLACAWKDTDTVPLFERRFPYPVDWSGFEFSVWVGLPYDPPVTGRCSTWLEDVMGTVRTGPEIPLVKAQWTRVADVCSLGGSTGAVQTPGRQQAFYPFAIVRAGVVFKGTFSGGSYNFQVLIDAANVAPPVLRENELVAPPWDGITWTGPASGLPPGQPTAFWDGFLWADYQKPASTDRGWG